MAHGDTEQSLQRRPRYRWALSLLIYSPLPFDIVQLEIGAPSGIGPHIGACGESRSALEKGMSNCAPTTVPVPKTASGLQGLQPLVT